MALYYQSDYRTGSMQLGRLRKDSNPRIWPMFPLPTGAPAVEVHGLRVLLIWATVRDSRYFVCSWLGRNWHCLIPGG